MSSKDYPITLPQWHLHEDPNCHGDSYLSRELKPKLPTCTFVGIRLRMVVKSKNLFYFQHLKNIVHLSPSKLSSIVQYQSLWYPMDKTKLCSSYSQSPQFRRSLRV